VSWDEDEIHRWLASANKPRAFVGSQGHDAAVTKRPRGRLVSCLDHCIEGVHVPGPAVASALGRKAANRALSDLAATAATPRGILLGLSAPRERDTRWIRATIQAVRKAAAAVGAELWGGDLAAAPGPARLSVTALGEWTGSGKPVGRDRARVGQWVICTGPLGGSLAGRHLRFEPRVDAGQRLAASGATAMMDVSDGLAWDLHRLARASQVCVELFDVQIHRDARRTARASGKTALWHALHDGEDHELIATLSESDALRVQSAAARRGESWTLIGRVRRGRGLRLTGAAADSDPREWSPDEGGFRHGR
jgi:thiamine-monophosphate kinase